MANRIEVEIVGDASGLTRAFGQGSRAADGFGRSLSGRVASGLKALTPLALGAAAAVGAGLVATLKVGFDELAEKQKVLATTETLIKNLGSATKLTSADIESYATEIQNATGLQDDMVVSAQNVLLRFESIASDQGVFRRATQVAADMSVALGKDVPAAAQGLARALADPEAAAGKLARMGVVLTEQQQKVIDKFIETGDAAGAQEYLLGLLEDKFKGVAEAAGDTLPGKIEILKRKFEDFAEGIATRVLPYAEKFVDFIGKLMDAGSAGEALGILGGAIKGLRDALGDALSGVDFGDLGSRLVEGIGGYFASFNWGGIAKGVAGALWGAVTAAFGAGADFGAEIGGNIGRKLGEWVAKGLAEATQLVVAAADKLLGAISTTLGALGEIPGAGKLKEWQKAIDEARESMRHWADGLGKAAARALTDTEAGFSTASRGAGELIASVGTLAGLKPPQIKALINDQEFLGKLATMVSKIQAMPGSKEFKAQALVDAAMGLIENYTTKVKAIPDSSKTTVSAPGVERATDQAGAMGGAVRGIPDSSKTTITTANASTAVSQANAVNNAVRAIPTSWTTYHYVVTSGGTGSGNVAGGLAGGTMHSRAGVFLTGEKGPELVELPAGSRVYPADQTQRMMGNGGMGGPLGGGPTITNYITVQGSIWKERELARSIRDNLVETIGGANPSIGFS